MSAPPLLSRRRFLLLASLLGGVKAFAQDSEPLSPGDFIGKWMELMAPAMERGFQSCKRDVFPSNKKYGF